MEAFVYTWVNLTNNKKYIGYHKGSLDDGYICSSKSNLFWNDFINPDMQWERVILFEGTRNECLEKEQLLLKDLDLMSDEYYNNARGASIIFSDEVIKKMSNSHKIRWQNLSDDERKEHSIRVSKAKTGKPCSVITKDKLKALYKNKTFVERFGENKAKEIGEKISKSNTGKHYHSEEHKQNLSLKLIGNKYGENQSKETRQIKREKWLNDNPGKNKSEETKRKISEARKGSVPWNKGQPRKKIICPHCGKEGGEGLMQRWHFNNCKNIKNEQNFK